MYFSFIQQTDKLVLLGSSIDFDARYTRRYETGCFSDICATSDVFVNRFRVFWVHLSDDIVVQVEFNGLLF